MCAEAPEALIQKSFVASRLVVVGNGPITVIGRLYRVAASDWLLRRTTDLQGKPDMDK